MGAVAQELLQTDLPEGFGPNADLLYGNLTKALEAGTGPGVGSVQGRSLIPESLEMSLYTVLHSIANTPLIRALKTEPVKSPVHQWTINREVGDDDGVFAGENQEAISNDSTFERLTQNMAYLQTLREVTLQMKMSNSIENPVAIETTNGILQLLRVIETNLFKGNSKVNPKSFDGILASVPTENLLDLRGKFVDDSKFEEKLDEGSEIVFNNFGEVTHAYFSPANGGEFNRIINSRIRFQGTSANASGDITYGNVHFTKYATTFSEFFVIKDVFNREKRAPRPSKITDKRPGTVTLSSAATSSSAGTKFFAGDAGSYSYQVALFNEFGEGPTSNTITVAGVVADDKVNLLIEDTGSIAPTAIRVFRAPVGTTTGHKEAFTLPIADVEGGDGGSGTEFEVPDTNADLPGTGEVYLLDQSEASRAIKWFSFLPAMKFQLYPTNKAVDPFLLIQFGALGLTIPERHTVIKNINTKRNTGFTFSGEGI